MKTLHLRPCLAWFLALAAVPALSAQSSFFLLNKAQRFLQTSATGSVANGVQAFTFGAISSVPNSVLTFPDGHTVPLLAQDDGFELHRTFTTKAALDTAFPNGSYRMSGTGIPALTFNLTPDTYPVAPQVTSVTNGNWIPGGVLVVNPALPVTLNFNPFTGYATAGIAGHTQAQLQGLEDNVEISVEAATVPLFGNPAQPTPITTLTIPAGTMAPGRLYQAIVDYDTVLSFDPLSVRDGLVVSVFSSSLDFVIAAQAPNTTPPPAPVITIQPGSQTAVVGGSVSFAYLFNAPVQFLRWYFNGQEIETDGNKYVLSSNISSFTINNLTASDAGTYVLRIANNGGIATSVPVTLTVVPGTPGAPVIARQPTSQFIPSGNSVAFSVAATAGSTYQWRMNGVALPATIASSRAPTLILSNVTPAQSGAYSVVVTNASGSTVSSPGLLQIFAFVGPPTRLGNLSILSPLAAGETMTMGTVLGGAGTAGPKPLLARAAGPSLSQLSVSGFLPDPTMTLNNISASPTVVVASNNDWAGTPALSAAFAAVGAFPYVNATSKDAAIFQAGLAPGNYTVEVKDAGTGTGTVIAELYDSTPPGQITAATPRLVNVSVLKNIPSGGSLTAGFVITGNNAKTLLIRAIGPALGLAPFNITGAMPDPQLTLVRIGVTPQVTVATNNDWGGDAGLAETAARIGAFAVTNAASRDAMLLITLDPGNYTAQVAPAAGTAGGTAIVEVYEVP